MCARSAVDQAARIPRELLPHGDEVNGIVAREKTRVNHQEAVFEPLRAVLRA